MVVKHIDHITINVKDLGKTFAFYENVLGLRRMDHIMDLGFGVVYYMQLPDGVLLELVEHRTYERSLETRNMDLGIYRHIAFTVDSLDEVKSRCLEHGGQIVLDRTYNEYWDYHIMLVADPNGVEIEFIEKKQK